MPDNNIIAEAIPKQLHAIPPPNGNGHGPSVEQIHEFYPFYSALLDLPELLRLTILDLVQALAVAL